MADRARFREAEARLWRSVDAAPSERFLDLARTGTTVRVQETGAGPAVLFVHGASNSGVSWAPLAARLHGYRCVLLDRPGCGLSPPLARPLPSIADLAAFAEAVLADVLDALALERAHVIATSFGGYLALRSAAAHPERVTRIVELGWMVGAPTARLPAIMRLASVPIVGRAMTAMPPTKGAVRAMFRGIGLRQALEAGRISQEVLDCYLSLLRDTDTMRNELEAGPRLISPRRGMDEAVVLSTDVLNRVRCPVRFIWGEEDPFGTPDIAQHLVARLPHAELELLPGAGHAVWLDDPDRVAASTGEFLAADRDVS